MHRTQCTNSAPLPHASSEPLPLPIAAPFTQCTRTLSLSPGHAVCVLQVSIAVRCRAGERCTRSPSPPRALPTWRARRRRARSRSLASCQSDCVALASRCAVLSTRLLDFADCTHIYRIRSFGFAPPPQRTRAAAALSVLTGRHPYGAGYAPAAATVGVSSSGALGSLPRWSLHHLYKRRVEKPHPLRRLSRTSGASHASRECPREHEAEHRLLATSRHPPIQGLAPWASRPSRLGFRHMHMLAPSNVAP